MTTHQKNQHPEIREGRVERRREGATVRRTISAMKMMIILRGNQKLPKRPLRERGRRKPPARRHQQEEPEQLHREVGPNGNRTKTMI